ncbi:phosphate ABC transporter permease subunit PstC [Deinococcus radiodurans R1 = ATCC 13939 = DSM 20539]|uniref:Phosphate transport system permease protein n=2 Tax=Deinococcus radiodurans TaxID=1299 RepID=Q9RYZ5_DEIRA|nr:phosphate ABC transporter, permease protein [Deinococcus radiodurans R1 = ATCC 13939 = DSM 20539]QEM72968.1 phosphate ABC transporter permease subunit PstC [Deinococcus radiodurans]UDL01931.1 phosphate ABC transporter permease subunit PstC [Deinococcus radiodurans R1 = ATCC 13939 = DSM 20539]HCE64435.1 phosphate ABC transporter permease subunit PstC [Deinococcus radiodurans]
MGTLWRTSTAMIEPVKSPPQLPGRLSSRSDRVFEIVILLLASIIALIFVLSVYQLGKESWPALQKFGLNFFTSRTWNPVNGEFGAVSMIAGTLITSLAALVISVPLAIASALFVAEYAPKWLANPVGYLIELLAAVPSVVYGLFALFVIAPLLAKWQATFFDNLHYPERFALFTKCSQLWAENHSSLQCFFVPNGGAGRGLALAIIILTVMILPYTASVARDVIRLVPADQREAMYALGATKWEVISRAILPYARAGIMGGVILALGRALGETLAVAMVIGDSQDVIRSLWGNASTMASVIANQFGDAQETIHRSSVVTLGLTLFFLSVLVNYLARIIITRLTPKGIQQ